MQRKKVYHVSLYLDLHAVTCPGVWLCPKGKVAVRVAMFGVSESTKKLIPSFPLFFHERFHFQKKYKKVSSLHQVERVLHQTQVILELLQYPQGTTECVKLAEFKATVGDIIYPPGGDMDLLFCTTDTFPGIIGPKGEVTTRLSLTEGGIKDNFAMPTTVLSKGIKGKQIEEPVIRQKPVCHTKHYLYCGCFDKNAAPRLLAKAMKMRKDILAKKRTSQEAIKQTPAHIMSHKNHGDFLPGYEEQCYDCDGDEVKFGKCNCCQEQTAFRATSNQISPRISEESFIKGKNMKDGFTTPSMPQPRWNPLTDYQYDKVVSEEEENNHYEKPPLFYHKGNGSPSFSQKWDGPSPIPLKGEGPLSIPFKGYRAPSIPRNGERAPSIPNNGERAPSIPHNGERSPSIPYNGDGPCCLCCPHAPGYVMKRKSSTENQYREIQSNYMEEKFQNYPMDRKKYQSNPTEGKMYQSNPTEGKMYQSVGRKKYLQSEPCRLCEQNNKLMEIVRKKNGDKQKEDNGQLLFYSNLCKAYQRLMHEYYLTPPGVNSPGNVNRTGTS